MNASVSNYYRSNDVQRRDAREILEEYSKLMRWRTDGQDTLIDIGCGSGDVTMDFILPTMPHNFEKVVGVDIAEDMVKHAKLFHQGPKVDFEILNIAGDDIKSILANHPDGFDHVTSFYCLHWEWNQKQAIRNISDLLKPEGDCLLVLLANHPIFDVYKELSRNNKWSTYMENVDRFISPYHYRSDPAIDFSDLLYSAGFSSCNVKVVQKTYIYDGLKTLKRNVSAINPFLVKMSTKLREDFFEDYLKTIVRMKIGQKKENENDYRFVTTYSLIIAYATK